MTRRKSPQNNPRKVTRTRPSKRKESASLIKSPEWKTATIDMFGETYGTPSPFKNRVLTRRSSIYVKNVKAGSRLQLSPVFQIQRSLKRLEKRGNSGRNSGSVTTQKKKMVLKEHIEEVLSSDKVNIISESTITTKKSKNLRKVTSSKVVSSKEGKGKPNTHVLSKPDPPKNKTSEPIILQGRQTRNKQIASDLNEAKNLNELSVKESKKKNTSESGKVKNQVNSKKQTDKEVTNKSDKKAVYKLKVVMKSTPRKSPVKLNNSQRSSKKSPSPSKALMSATEMKRLLDEASDSCDDDSLYLTPGNKKQLFKANLKYRETPEATIKPKVVNKQSTPKLHGKTPSKKRETPKAVMKKVCKETTPKTTRLAPSIQSKTFKTAQRQTTPKFRKTPTGSDTNIPMGKGNSFKRNSTRKAGSSIASPKSTLKYSTPASVIAHKPRKTVKIDASENKTPKSPIVRQLTPARVKTGSTHIFHSTTKSREVPVKAARILGTVQMLHDDPLETKVVPPKTSTPARTIKRKSDITVPPVSEIRKIKKLKPALNEGNNIECLNETLDVSESLNASASEPLQTSVQLDTEDKKLWWGYCSVM